MSPEAPPPMTIISGLKFKGIHHRGTEDTEKLLAAKKYKYFDFSEYSLYSNPL
jgi:hypothetical protein